MGIPATTSEFLKVVRKSGVLENEFLEKYLRGKGKGVAEPAALADLLVADGVLTPFQRKHMLAGRYRGLVLGPYILKDHLGKGGNSLVFQGEHRKMRRRVAVKVLPSHRCQDQESLERFYREARAVASLDHRNIIRAHDIGNDAGVHYLVMEFIEGQSLQDYVEKRGPLPVEEAAGMVAQVLDGLGHAHERGLIHRDIKPANILLDRDGTVKILDMGLALFFEEPDDGLTRNLSRGAVLGTADYISPEQALDCHEVDLRTDIYSLGATFYTLLNGQPPFHHSKLTQKIIDHQIKEPPPIHEVQRSVPRELSAVVSKMMAKRREDRYQNVAETLAALQPWLASETSAVEESPSADENDTLIGLATMANRPESVGREPATIPPSKSRGLWIGAACAAVLLIGSAVGWLLTH